MKPMPALVELEPPFKTDVHTVEECDEVLSRHPEGVALDAWLDERLSAMEELQCR